MSLRVHSSRLPGVMVWLALIAMGTGCYDSDVIIEKRWPPAPRFQQRTSPENLLNNLELAYNTRNLAEYESLLAWNFEFVLSEEDASKPDMPDSWGRAPEIQLHRRLFDAELIQILTLEFTAGNLEWDAARRMPTILVRHVNIYLYGATPGHPTEVSERQLQDDCSRFWFVKNPWTTPAGQDSVWAIARWEDAPVADSCSAAGSFTWGALKAIGL